MTSMDVPADRPAAVAKPAHAAIVKPAYITYKDRVADLKTDSVLKD